MIKYLTKENVTLFLSILSIILSLISFARILVNEYVRLSVDYHGHLSHEIRGQTKLMIYLTITNKSRLSVSISSAFLEIENQKYQFEFLPSKVLEETTTKGNEVIERRTTYTINMPQTILGLGVLGGYFGIKTDLPKEALISNPSINVVLNTNKKILKFPITLSKSERV